MQPEPLSRCLSGGSLVECCHCVLRQCERASCCDASRGGCGPGDPRLGSVVPLPLLIHGTACTMRWRARAAPSRAKERANISFFIFIMFFAVFGVIILTELLLLERPNATGSTRSKFNEDLPVRHLHFQINYIYLSLLCDKRSSTSSII